MIRIHILNVNVNVCIFYVTASPKKRDKSSDGVDSNHVGHGPPSSSRIPATSTPNSGSTMPHSTVHRLHPDQHRQHDGQQRPHHDPVKLHDQQQRELHRLQEHQQREQQRLHEQQRLNLDALRINQEPQHQHLVQQPPSPNRDPRTSSGSSDLSRTSNELPRTTTSEHIRSANEQSRTSNDHKGPDGLLSPGSSSKGRISPCQPTTSHPLQDVDPRTTRHLQPSPHGPPPPKPPKGQHVLISDLDLSSSDQNSDLDSHHGSLRRGRRIPGGSLSDGEGLGRRRAHGGGSVSDGEGMRGGSPEDEEVAYHQQNGMAGQGRPGGRMQPRRHTVGGAQIREGMRQLDVSIIHFNKHYISIRFLHC